MTAKVVHQTELRFLLVTLIIAGLGALLVIRPFLSFLFVGLLIVYGFFPLHRRIRRKVRHPALAASVTFGVVVLAILGPLVIAGFFVFKDAVAFAGSYDPDHLNETIQPIFSSFGMSPESGQQTSEAANWVGAELQELAASFVRDLGEMLPHLALGLLILAFVVYYGFIDGERFYRAVRHAMPLPDQVEDHLFTHIRDVTNAVFIATLWISFLAAVVSTGTFLLFGVPNALFWGLLQLIIGVVPIIGPQGVWVPVCLWLYIEGRPEAALVVFLINTIVVFGYVEHVLRPRLIGRLGRMHPVWVVVGVLGGLEVFGFLGFVLGPIVLGIFLALLENFTEVHPRWASRRRRGVEPYLQEPHADVKKAPTRSKG